MLDKSASHALRNCNGAANVQDSDREISIPQDPVGLRDFALGECSESRVTLLARDGIPVHIEVLQDCGVAIEVRYDLADRAPVRQDTTGQQEQILRSPIFAQCQDQRIDVSGGGYGCTVNAATGAVSFLLGKSTLLASDSAMFLRHSEPVRIHERLESTQAVANERVYQPALNLGYFASLAVTFQYARPSGLVLGLPGSAGEMNRNGYRFQLYNSDNSRHTPSRQPLYQSWPIVFHQSPDRQHWVGVFHDNPSRTFVDLGELHPANIRFESIAGNTRVYVVGGHSLEEVSHRMIKLIGAPPRLAPFCFGYQQSRWSFFNSAEVRTTVERFRSASIPLDVIYFDIDYLDRYRVFTINESDFPDFPQLVSDLHQKGIHSVGILNPGIKREEGYEPFEELKELDGAIKLQSGEQLTGEAWAGACFFPDFYSEPVRHWWRDRVATWIKETDLDGAWNDMNEPTNWKGKNDATSEAITSAGPMFERFNLYGLQMASATREGLEKARPTNRFFNITRSGYPGVQKHSVIWHGDNSAWWEHLQLALDTAVMYSLAGAFYTGADVPGFGQNAPDDLAVRFFQLGAFLPFFRGHRHILSKPNEPFDFSPEANAIIRQAIHLRYSLLREWVTGYECAVRNQVSPMLPVLSPQGSLVRDQFMLFDTFLVAPVLHRDQIARLVWLPPGIWFRFGRPDERITGECWITEPVTLESLPVFVREGRVITINTVGNTAAETLSLPEVFHVYPSSDGSATGFWSDEDVRSGLDTPRLYRLSADRHGVRQELL